MENDKVTDIILSKINNLENKVDVIHEDITILKTERKQAAKISGGIWGIISAVAVILVKSIVDFFNHSS